MWGIYGCWRGEPRCLQVNVTQRPQLLLPINFLYCVSQVGPRLASQLAMLHIYSVVQRKQGSGKREAEVISRQAYVSPDLMLTLIHMNAILIANISCFLEPLLIIIHRWRWNPKEDKGVSLQLLILNMSSQKSPFGTGIVEARICACQSWALLRYKRAF